MKRDLARYVTSFAIMLLLWWLGSISVDFFFSGPQSSILPNPIRAFSTLINNWGAIWPNFVQSGIRLVISLTSAILVGASVGLVIGFEEKISNFASPILYLVYPVPKIVFLPVILILFGLGDLSRIIFIFLVAVFQVMLSARDAAKNISPRWIKAVRSSGGNKLQIYRHVVIPATLPSVLSSARISIGLGIAALYLAELSYTNVGLGYYINNSWKVFAYSNVFAGILAFAALGLGLYAVIEALERALCRWNFLE
jgi:NitT/TauT family transport system permease protein